MQDQSNAQTRTAMAWQRTALALGVLATIALKLALSNHQIIGFITAIGALIGAGVLYVFGRLRFESTKGPFILLTLTAGVVIMLGVATIAQII
jgi:peptidoglycan biosynthesis protein MviN/MurJ (putative lipid II flippase)